MVVDIETTFMLAAFGSEGTAPATFAAACSKASHDSTGCPAVTSGSPVFAGDVSPSGSVWSLLTAAEAWDVGEVGVLSVVLAALVVGTVDDLPLLTGQSF